MNNRRIKLCNLGNILKTLYHGWVMRKQPFHPLQILMIIVQMLQVEAEAKVQTGTVGAGGGVPGS